MPPPAYGALPRAAPGQAPGAFWPGGEGGPGRSVQGGGKPDKFDNFSVAYYSAYGPQQMAAAAAVRSLPPRRPACSARSLLGQE